MVAPATPTGVDTNLSLLALENLTLTLTATDSNSFASAGALSVWITQLPSYGILYQTMDGITLDSAITTIPSPVSNPNFSVIYVNTAATALYSGLSVLYTEMIMWQPSLTYNGTVIQSAVSEPAKHTVATPLNIHGYRI